MEMIKNWRTTAQMQMLLKAYERNGQTPEDQAAMIAENLSLRAELDEEKSRRYQAESNYDHAMEDRNKISAELAREQSKLSAMSALCSGLQAELDTAEKCIRDIETYLELRSGRFIKKTIDAWRSRYEAGESGRDG